MNISKITVHAGRTLQHPCQSYANIRPSLTLEATLQESDDPAECLKQLQLQAERAVEEHAAVLVASLEERQLLQREADDIRRLTQSVADGQQQLESLKARVESRGQQTMFALNG